MSPRDRATSDDWPCTPLVAAAIWAAVASVTPTFLTAPIFLESDAGVFYSVFHQLSQGRRLYVDVFDHKDPLFYGGHTLAYVAMGPRGPMIWEGILSLVLLLGVLELGARCGLGLAARVLLALVFAAVHFLPPVYLPIHTYQQALALVLVALCLVGAGRPGLAGAAFAAAVASKLTLVTLLPAFGVFVVMAGAGGLAWRGRLLWAAAGGVVVAVVVAGGLAARGELGGYVDALVVNLLYPARNPVDATSFVDTPSLWGHVVTLFTLPLAILYLALVAIAWVLALLVREPVPSGIPIRATVWLAPLTFVGTLATLSVASWWAHHFQMAGLAFTLALLPLLTFAQAAVRRGDSPTTVRPRAALVASIGVPLVVLGLVGSVLADRMAVQRLGWQPYDRCRMLVSVHASFSSRRPECDLLQQRWPEGTRFATIQVNDPGTLAAWTPPSMILACRVFYQFSWLAPSLLDEINRCLSEGDVDVIFRAAPPGSNRRPDDPFLGLLRSSYRMVHRYGDIEVWDRRD